MLPLSRSNPSAAQPGRPRFLLKTTGAALLALSAAALPLHAGGPVAAPIKGGGAVGVSAKTTTMPDNLALGLQEMATDYNAALANGARTLSATQFTSVAANYPLARSDSQQRVQVEVMLDGTVAMSDLIATCQAAGCDITAQIPWYRQGTFSMWMPLSQAATLAQTKGVDSIKLSLKPRHHAGKVPGQGAKVLNALTAQTNYNTLGAGITVGAQSDSYNALSTSYPVHAAQDVASGDLPGTGNPEGYTTPVNVLSDYSGGEDEGRAMLQIIHDVAPASPLAFASADISEAGFAANIIALSGSPNSTYSIPTSSGTKTVAGAGCKVVCDDVGYYDEPFFSDGPVAQAVDKASAAGAVYFSSAGNDGNSGWAGTFNPVNNDSTAQALLLSEGGITYSGITATESAVISKYHSFGTNAQGQPILVQKVYIPLLNASSYGGTLIFQWDDPDALVTNGIKQITTDFDILAFSVAANGTATYQSTLSGRKSNFSTNTPIEIPNGTFAAGTQYELVIVLTNRTDSNTGGPARDQATHLMWVLDSDATQIIADFNTPASVETHGHPCAATCAGTAAYVYDDQFLYSDATYTPIVEAYSSNGPATIYFDSAGNRLATPVVRKQPLLSAVDGVSTTFFPPTAGTTAPGPSNPDPSDSDGDGYPNFFGTSAAAPHGAGCAALLLSAAAANNIALTPADVRTLLTSTTQGQSDQDPSVANATAGATKFSARDRGTYADPQAYTITYNGAAGTT
ncbi:MAG: S8 family serine peptidase, partial [Gluconacetobacter diazotrophicus]|nr:S8 family serine peptidase [Gluconacetobacter diazotrophicus]